LSVLITILMLAENWRLFQKMGRQGWEGIVPLYNTYVLFRELYGNGWKMLLLLIPIFNIYVFIKLQIDLARAFHQSIGFAIGIIFLAPVFLGILAFGSSVYQDGSAAVVGDDPVSRTLDQVVASANNVGSAKPKKDPDALEKIKELSKLREQGILTEEEFLAKKAELLEQV